MKTKRSRFLPEARSERLVTKKVAGEVLVYDCETDKAHCLNPLAGAIWSLCDGRTTVAEIAASLAKEFDSTVNEQVVWLGLDELRRKHLMEKTIAWPARTADRSGMSSISRRDAIRRVGFGAAIALPLVISITAPMPAQAATCKPRGAACSINAECCSGRCRGNGTCN